VVAFDVSVLEVGEGVVEVKRTNGDTHLGGDDWDAVLTEYIVAEFKKFTGMIWVKTGRRFSG